MGKFDRRKSMKMRRRQSQAKLKARLKRRRLDSKKAGAPKKAAPKKSSPPKSERGA